MRAATAGATRSRATTTISGTRPRRRRARREARERVRDAPTEALLHRSRLKPNVAGIHEMPTSSSSTSVASAGHHAPRGAVLPRFASLKNVFGRRSRELRVTLAKLRGRRTTSFGNEALGLSGGGTLGPYTVILSASHRAEDAAARGNRRQDLRARWSRRCELSREGRWAFVLSDQQDLFREMGAPSARSLDAVAEPCVCARAGWTGVQSCLQVVPAKASPAICDEIEDGARRHSRAFVSGDASSRDWPC